ncbi:hypothetical protein MOE97_16695 [Bacillus spizizenii]|nr:hypothetical protein [Bacillus spizizenii]
MIKKLTCTVLLLCLISPPLGAKALNFSELPTKQSSKEWSVQVSEATDDKGLAKPEKGKFHTYSLKIKKVGDDDLTSAEIRMFRNEPNSSTKFSLFGCANGLECSKNHFEETMTLARSLNDGTPFEFHNFTLADKSTELEVEIAWTKKGSEGRLLKETFTFNE